MKIGKFFMSILKVQVNFPSNFASILSAIKHDSSAFFLAQEYFGQKNTYNTNKYFGQKEPIKVQIFETFECSGENFPSLLCHFPNHKSVFLQSLHHSSVS